MPKKEKRKDWKKKNELFTNDKRRIVRRKK